MAVWKLCLALIATGAWTTGAGAADLSRGEAPPLAPPRRYAPGLAGAVWIRPAAFDPEQLHCVRARLRHSSAAAGAWLMAKKEKIMTEEEIYAEKVRKVARSVDQVLGATVSGFIGPWIIGWIFGTATGFKGGGLRGAMGNGVSTGTAWGTMSAAFCGVEVLARECRGGVTDKWNNMMGACSAGCVGNIGKGPGMMVSGCVNFAAFSYILDLLIHRNTDPFEQAIMDPSSVDKDMMTKQKTNAKT